MDMMGQFAKDLRGFQNLAGLTSQNQCGWVVVHDRTEYDRQRIVGALPAACPLRAETYQVPPDMSASGQGTSPTCPYVIISAVR